MDVSSAAASVSALSAANVQAQASMMVLKKSMDVQATAALQLIEALPQAAPAPVSGNLGTVINTYA